MKKIISEYFKTGSLQILDISSLNLDGEKTMMLSVRVENKKEAKEVSKQYNAKPWNF
jgi:hypothetical protein